MPEDNAGNVSTGVIQRLVDKATREGKSYKSVQIDGDWYGVWDKKYFEGLEQGKEIKFTWRQKGDFKNIISVDFATPPMPPGAPTPPRPPSQTDLGIARMNALTNSRELVTAGEFYATDEEGRRIPDMELQARIVLLGAKPFFEFIYPPVEEPEPEPPDEDRFAGC